jgi:hypothetical protein
VSSAKLSWVSAKPATRRPLGWAPNAVARLSGMSSKKKLIGTSSTRDRSNSRDAPTRLTPRSYFCTC